MSIFTIPKPGQGKIARLGSAVGFGIIVLTTVFWVVSEIGSAFSHLSRVRTEYGALASTYNRFAVTEFDAHRMQVTPETVRRILANYGRELGDGESVDLSIRPIGGGFRTMFTITEVVDNGPGQPGTLVLASPLARNLEEGRVIESGVERNVLVFVTGGTGAFLIIVCLLILFYILNRPRIVDFLIATEDEMRKVNWPSKKEVIGSTWVVILGTLFMGLALWIVDLIFAEIFMNIGILEGQSTIQALLNRFFPTS